MRHGLLANESKCVNPLWNPCLLTSACFNCEPKLTKNPTPLLLLPSSLPSSLAKKKKKATQALLPFYSCVAGNCVWIRRDRHTCTSAIQNEYTSLQRYRMSTLHFSDTEWVTGHSFPFSAGNTIVGLKLYTLAYSDGDISSSRKIFTCRFPETDVAVSVTLTLCKENWIWIFRERVTCSRGQTLRAQTWTAGFIQF